MSDSGACPVQPGFDHYDIRPAGGCRTPRQYINRTSVHASVQGEIGAVTVNVLNCNIPPSQQTAQSGRS